MEIPQPQDPFKPAEPDFLHRHKVAAIVFVLAMFSLAILWTFKVDHYRRSISTDFPTRGSITNSPNNNGDNGGPDQGNKNALIEGSLGYPSEGIPEGMEVCAEKAPTKEKVGCTNTHIKDGKYAYGYGYKLEVPPGEYYVYAHLDGGVHKAYYSEFVKCEMLAECKSHEPILLKLLSEQHATKIDPQDWYGENDGAEDPGTYIEAPGDKTVSGTYRYSVTGNQIDREVCFWADDASKNIIPRPANDNRAAWFCFSNNDEAIEMLKISTLVDDNKSCYSVEGQAKVEIDDYLILAADIDGTDKANLVRVVTNSGPKFVDEKNNPNYNC